MNPDKALPISEIFYSLQGEGPSAGVPSIFIRTPGCPLNCVFCDTAEVWRSSSPRMYQQLWDWIMPHAESLAYQKTHLVLTGGDPMLVQSKLVDFLDYLTSLVGSLMYVEVETEGWIQPTLAFANRITQWNVSPKLSNSGIPSSDRINLAVLKWHAVRWMSSLSTTWFKFVVREESDMEEVLWLCNKASIAHDQVVLMPLCSTRAEQDAVAAKVAQFALDYSFRYSPRLHLQIWDVTTGK